MELDKLFDTAGRLGTCSVCSEHTAKYSCPACDVKSCSLTCVQSHKKNKPCMGVRDRTVKVEKENMDNLMLLNDYRFLEEIDHKLEDGLRNPLRRHIAPKHINQRPDLPPHLYRLKCQAKNRGTILEYIPEHFSKHQENSTRYKYKEGKIRWHIKWIFHQANVTFVDESVDEDTAIVDILDKYMEPGGEMDQETAEKLCFYHSASFNRISVLLKNEMTHPNEAEFQEMFMSKSLKLNFFNKRIVEYPVFYVVLRDHIHSYLDYQATGHQDLFADPDLQQLKKMNQIKSTMMAKDNHQKHSLNSSSFNSNDNAQGYSNNNAQNNLSSSDRIRKKDGRLSFFDAYSDDSDNTTDTDME
ncbi:unnamed protein product [Meganyctiphanes norvegica]|uniref:HIT-type domain-containing protein n=1 Tax=Meganyctiphanes norvegica TaxID=48144 RepID=A0AAV2S3Z2_MEGNR